jgi:hypothetical protein
VRQFFKISVSLTTFSQRCDESRHRKISGSRQGISQTRRHHHVRAAPETTAGIGREVEKIGDPEVGSGPSAAMQPCPGSLFDACVPVNSKPPFKVTISR